MKRRFEEIIGSLRDSIATYNYYVDFDKVYRNVSKVEMQLNLLNYLIGKDNIEQEFMKLIVEYPDVIEVIPILLAVREGEIKIIDGEVISYSFKKMNREVADYTKLLRESGLVELLEKKKIKNLVDYVTGVEVGLDTNARKNRTGHLMEDIVESYIKKIPNVDYLKEATKNDIKKHFKTDELDDLNLDDEKKTNKRFDFVVKSRTGKLLLIETNFYGGSGSKLNETARSYAKLGKDIKGISGIEFVWITDGKGWRSTQNNLREAYGVIEHLYTLDDLDNGVLEKI
ncbi:MAG: type II restriction endonuclease [Bacilli bacterium]|nr:type II restriction endonuclease [Bacilli bacterium]MDD4734293.1 type II restriction endonuclease [Bacilli bacterium]